MGGRLGEWVRKVKEKKKINCSGRAYWLVISGKSPHYKLIEGKEFLLHSFCFLKCLVPLLTLGLFVLFVQYIYEIFADTLSGVSSCLNGWARRWPEGFCSPNSSFWVTSLFFLKKLKMCLSSSERQEKSACHDYLQNDCGPKLLSKGFMLAPSLRGMSAAWEIRLCGVDL